MKNFVRLLLLNILIFTCSHSFAQSDLVGKDIDLDSMSKIELISLISRYPEGDTSFKIYKLLAEKYNDSIGQFNIGVIYLYGFDGKEKNSTEGIK